jgi:dTDP-4-amino-4,6-dideoxygalactose transaminase
MDPILEIAKKYDLVTIEDSAQAIGAVYKGRKAGGMGDMGCFSFFPSKNLGAFGDGGIVTTSSDELYKKLKSLRVHGSGPKYYHQYLGGNFRLDALQAAIVHVKFSYLEKWTVSRQANAAKYRDLFNQMDLNEIVKLPVEREERHIYNQFVIAVSKQRERLREYLEKRGIGTEVYYPIPMHLQPCFQYLGGRKNDFPNAEAAAEMTLALPIFPELTEDQQIYVVESIKAFYN